MSNKFDWIFYVNYYKDLNKNGIDTEERALEHWLNFGKKEKRYPNDKFDWLFYINYNKDLKLLNINTEEKAYEHWINFGLYEDRICKRNNFFDWKFYLNYYKDLNKLINGGEEKANYHWENYGKNENRITNDTYLCEDYIFEIEDINNSFEYTANSDIEDYIQKYAKYGRVFNEKKNHLDIDLLFFKKGNNLNINNKEDLLLYFHKNYNGLIYHPKQLLNIYPNIIIYKKYKFIIVVYNEKEYILSNFLDNFIYKKDFNYFSDILIKNIEDKLTSSSLLLLVFIGNLNIGLLLIKKVIEYCKIEECNVSFCFNTDYLCDKLKDVIINDIKNYAIYVSNEFGNDIIPTLLMYNLINKKYNYKNIIKLQTKSNSKYFNELTDFLLKIPKRDLIKSKIINSNCINDEKYYIKIINDQFNRDLNDLYSNYIDCNKSFVKGTIFYTKDLYFKKILNFMIENNFKAYILNNMYDDNRTFFYNSYVHFLERLFGVIK
jgi:hypothetical protein